jgi:hypothetical protein
MKADRIQLSRKKDWRLPPNTVNCARPGPLGNPFIVGVHGNVATCVDLHRKLLAGFLCMGVDIACIERQKKLFAALPAQLARLRQADHAACWCRLDKPCHVDNYLEVLRLTPPPSSIPHSSAAGPS